MNEFTSRESSAVSPNAWPAFRAAMFAFAISARLANFFPIDSIVACRSRPYIHSISPSAHMLRQRSASFWPSPKGLTASSVCLVMSSLRTW